MAATMALRGLLFDMDGVLIDSLPSILACMNHTLVRLGRAPVGAEQVRPLIGPPLEVSALQLIGDPSRVPEFVAVYRERYAETCVRETLAMPGLKPVLTTLGQRWPLAVATSKAELYVRPILAALGVEALFARGGIFGRSLALDSEDKATVVGRACAALGGAQGLLMIGDREHDVIGARAHGIDTIGVLHGMGSREELARAGAKWIASDLYALPRLIERIDAGLA
jgi:phosphoglycolate phosphatase